MFTGDDINDYYSQYQEFTRKNKQNAWRYELKIEGYDLTIYAYTVSTPLFEISHDTSEIATIEKSRAERLELRNPTFNIFDNETGENRAYFEDWKEQIIPCINHIPNGLVRLPEEYTRKLTIQPLSFTGHKIVSPVIINCWVNKVGDLEFSRTESKLLEFPVSLIEQRTS